MLSDSPFFGHPLEISQVKTAPVLNIPYLFRLAKRRKITDFHEDATHGDKISICDRFNAKYFDTKSPVGYRFDLADFIDSYFFYRNHLKSLFLSSPLVSIRFENNLTSYRKIMKMNREWGLLSHSVALSVSFYYFFFIRIIILYCRERNSRERLFHFVLFFFES